METIENCCVLCLKHEGQEVNDETIRLYQLPENENKRKICIEKIQDVRPNTLITENTRVCNLHFENKIYNEDSVPVHLLFEEDENMSVKKVDENLNNTEDNSANNLDTEEPSCSTSVNQTEDKPEVKLSLKEQLAQIPVCPSLRKEPVSVSLCSINTYITCALCGGYLYEASTITECMHTFCKTCIVRHIEKCLNCPTCDTQIHPTDPIVNIRHDSTIQDIVYRLLPNVAEEEQRREKEYYEEHERKTGERILPKLTLPPPPPTTPPAKGHDPFSFPIQRKKKTNVRSHARQIKREVKRYFNTNFVSLQLEYDGDDNMEESPLLQVELDKKFLRVTSKATAGNIVTFIKRKLQLEKFYHRNIHEAHIVTYKDQEEYSGLLSNHSIHNKIENYPRFYHGNMNGIQQQHRDNPVDLYHPTSTAHHLLPANSSLEKIREQYYDGEDLLMELRYRITEDL